jgi:ABC-2 type transport system ATP-binding protein
MSETVISCSKVSKIYSNSKTIEEENFFSLKDVSFEAKKGDRIGLIGLNGSGKSTLLKILAGQIKPSSGVVELMHDAISLSHFDSLLHPDLSGEENIKLQLNLLGVKSENIHYAIEEIIEFSELRSFINKPVKTYSSGMMLRLTFSMFKAIKPKILLLDEVFSAGDFVFQKKASLLIKNYLSASDCIVMASHNLSEIKAYCNKCLILEKGMLVFAGSIDDSINVYFNRNRKKSSIRHISLKEVTVEAPNEEIIFSKNVKVKAVYEKKDLKNIDAVLYLRNSSQNVLTDCMIYRSDFKREIELDGIYLLEFEIPAELLNIGLYFIDLSFGDGDDELEYFENCATFKIIPDLWEKERLWNLNPTFPIRPKIKWKKSLLNQI